MDRDVKQIEPRFAETPGDISMVLAGPEDETATCALGDAFALEDGSDFDLAAWTKTVRPVLAKDNEFGLVFLIKHGDLAIGYAVVCFGYSLEFGGRDAFLDEFYVAPDYRNKGLGAWALKRLKAETGARGARALHLEVLERNRRAADLYERSGFTARGSMLYSARLET